MEQEIKVGQKYVLNTKIIDVWYIRSNSNSIKFNTEGYWPITIIEVDSVIKFSHPNAEISYCNVTELADYLLLYEEPILELPQRSRLELILD